MSERQHSIEELEAYRAQAAQIVACYGERYLPIFERLDREVESRRATIDKALQIAASVAATGRRQRARSRTASGQGLALSRI